MNSKNKRGRKPKNKLVVNENPCFDKENTDIIIKIQNNDTKTDNIYDNIYDNLDKNAEVDNILDNIKNKCIICNNENTNSVLPVKYIDNIFYVIDCFCSKKCIENYIFQRNHYNMYELYSIYIHYNNMIKNNANIKKKYINNTKKCNTDTNIQSKNLKLFRCKKDNNILNFINKV